MSLKSRVNNLESNRGGLAEVFISVLIYEAPPSEGEDEEIVTAQIIWGPRMVAGFKREKRESTDDFSKRMSQIGNMSWPEAKKRYGLCGD